MGNNLGRPAERGVSDATWRLAEASSMHAWRLAICASVPRRLIMRFSDSDDEEAPQLAALQRQRPPGLRDEDLPALFWCVL